MRASSAARSLAALASWSRSTWSRPARYRARPVADHHVRRPDGGHLWQRRERRGLLELRGNLGGRAADGGPDAVRGRRYLSLTGGNRGQRQAELRLRPLRIECAAAPRVEPLLRKVERAALVLGVPPGH